MAKSKARILADLLGLNNIADQDTTSDNFGEFTGAGQTGPKGNTGSKGPTGTKGPVGPKGLGGPKGPQGSKGPQGTSIKGSVGPKGDVGSKGPKGGTGTKGPGGPGGPKGPEGPKGPGGPGGPKGQKGQKGQKGAGGGTGPKGQKGAGGPKGPAGPNGTDLRGSSNVDKWWGNNNDYIFADASHGLRFYTAGSEDMRLTDGGNLHVDADVIAYSSTVSDENLKEDITIIENALDLLSKIDGVTFNLKRDGKKSAGVIAQQVEKVLPSAVKTRTKSLDSELDGNQYKTVEYNQLIGLIIEAIKELNQKVENLKK